MTRRSRMEILVDILKAVDQGKQKPTHIMYSTNMCWNRMRMQLDFLTMQEMLVSTQVNGETLYTITPKGKEILEYFTKIEGEIYHNKRALATAS